MTRSQAAGHFFHFFVEDIRVERIEGAPLAHPPGCTLSSARKAYNTLPMLPKTLPEPRRTRLR